MIDRCGIDCRNLGECVIEDEQLKCECKRGFIGRFCETNINDCIGITCKNGGTCLDAINNYQCECLLGFTGTHCEDNINDCIGVACSGRGEVLYMYTVNQSLLWPQLLMQCFMILPQMLQREL